MNKILRKLIASVLVCTISIGFSTTTFAASEPVQLGTQKDKTDKEEWWKFAWKILVDYTEKLINLDGSSINNREKASLTSPSIEYNTGDMGGEVYFRPQVDSTVGDIRMYGYRVVSVDVFSKIVLILSDASGRTVKQATNGTNQFMYYTRTSSDTSGKWKAQFVSSESYKWQLHYVHYYNTKSGSQVDNDGCYFGDNNRVYHFSEINNKNTHSTIPSVVDMTELNKQFINPTDGKNVDYLKDYNVGDKVNFADKIVDINYDSNEDATTFYFMENTSKEKIGWKFNGNLTSEYKVGDTMKLSFDVLNIGTYQDIIFEGLDYFEEAFEHEEGMPYPNINDYR